MDDLIQSVLREIAFDGDYGCDASRLTTFITSFCITSSDNTKKPLQKVDDGFRALVWSYIVQLPQIRVGFKPARVKDEVFVAANVKAARNLGQVRQIYMDAKKEEERPPLEGLAIEEVRASSLDGLLAKYGSKLRVAVDADTCFEALTGSHLRVRTITPMVYTTLQLIARSREEGLTFVDIDKATGYSAGTVFYLVKQLESLNLVKKLTKVSKHGTQMAVHKYFYDNSPFWARIQEEERDAINKAIPEGKVIRDGSIRSGSVAVQADAGSAAATPKDDDDAEDLDDDADDVEEEDITDEPMLFDPIDARHLGMPTVIIGRVVRLLQHSKDHTRVQANMVVRIGFPHPTKKERRRFNKIMNVAVHRGIFERVRLPRKAVKPNRSKVIPCIRLASAHANLTDDAALANLVSDADVPMDTLDDNGLQQMQQSEGLGTHCMATLPFQKQLVTLIDEAGANGLTHYEITSNLGFWDKRTIEHQLEKMSKEPPPPHLSDLGIVSLLENVGRERRLKHYTTRGYALLKERDGITDDHKHLVENKELVSSFAVFSSDNFYKDNSDLARFLTVYTPKRIISAPKTPRRKGVRVAKQKEYKNPLGEDGKRRKGRPRKDWNSTAPIRKTPKKRDREEDVDELDEGPKKKRAKRQKTHEDNLAEDSHAPVGETAVSTGDNEVYEGAAMEIDGVAVAETLVASAPKKRGRPRKVQLSEDAIPPEEKAPQDTAASPTRPSSRKRKAAEELASQATPSRSKRSRKDAPASTPAPGVDSTAEAVVEQMPVPVPSFPDRVSGSHVGALEADGTGPQFSLSVTATSYKRPRRPNITYHRRAQELLETLKRLGGITYVANHLSREHQRYVQSLVEAGEREPGSATLMDKKTLANVLDDLVRSKDLKRLTTSSFAPFGGPMRATTFVYLSDTPDDQVNDYRIRIEDQMRLLSSATESRIPNQKWRKPEVVTNSGEEIPGSGPVTNRLTPDQIRQNLLREAHTIAQLYGFVLGIFWRARELHLYTLHEITGRAPSAHIVSLSERIVNCAYFFECLPVGTWCGLVPIIEYDAALEEFLHTPEGPDTLLRSAPPEVQRACGFVRARPRGKLSNILELLAALGIVTPLEVATQAPDIVCQDVAAGKPSSFRRTKFQDLHQFPLFFRFNTRVAVYDYRSRPAPLLTVADIGSVDNSVQFWNILESLAKSDGDIVINSVLPETFVEEQLPKEIEAPDHDSLKHFTKQSAWQHTYKLSERQKNHIRSASARQEKEDVSAWLRELSYAVVAPEDAVHKYLEALQKNPKYRAQTEHTPPKEVIEEEEEPHIAALNVNRSNAQFLAAKAAESKALLEQSWDALVKQTLDSLVPGTYQPDSPSLADIRKKWWQRGGQVNLDNYRDQIISAVTGTALPLVGRLERRFLPTKRHRGRKEETTNTADSEVVMVDENDIQHCAKCERELATIWKFVEQQEALLPPDKLELKVKRPKKAADGSRATRGKRFVWTPEYDQLALDADAVLRGRTAGRKVIDLSILNRIFPLVNVSGVRNRIARLQNDRAGGVAYSQQLAAAWDVLRSQPNNDVLDPYPDSIRHFPIERHIAYLRAHLDKTKLCVPAEDDPQLTYSSRRSAHNLPKTVSELNGRWEVIEPAGEPWEHDFMWNVLTEELREKSFHHDALVVPSRDLTATLAEAKSTEDCICEVAVKMAVSVPEDEYNEKAAAGMLHLLGEERVQTAFTNLSRHGVLTKAAGEKKLASGRVYMISEAQLLGLAGPLPWRMFRDAEMLEKEIAQDDSEPWSLMATDGKTAGVINLISDDRVDLIIDQSTSTVLKVSAISNNRRIGDDRFENSIYVSLKDDISPAQGRSLNDTDSATKRVVEQTVEQPPHEVVHVKCGRNGDGPINCPTCIAKSLQDYFGTLEDADRDRVQRLYVYVESTGEHGASLLELETFCQTADIPVSFARETLARMSRLSVPVFSVIGYESGALISSTFLKSVCVQLAGDTFDMTYPRRWMNANGKRCEAIWQSALRCVMGWICVRTGISEALLRKRVATVLDRPELNDVLQVLLERGFAVRKDSRGSPVAPELVGFSSSTEEWQWHWHMGDVPFYRVH